MKPAFALVSMNMIPNSRDFASPSSIETCLFQYQNGFVKKISDGEIKNTRMETQEASRLVNGLTMISTICNY